MPRYKNPSKEGPAKEIPGTDKVARGGDPTQLRKMRCPACQRIATAQVDGSGKAVAVCACGRKFVSRPLSS